MNLWWFSSSTSNIVLGRAWVMTASTTTASSFWTSPSGFLCLREARRGLRLGVEDRAKGYECTGFGLSERFAAEGMRVAMADVEEPALAEAAQILQARGAEVLPVPTDVSRADHVEALRDRTLSVFGAAHVVCNNAGVGGAPNPVW